MLRAEVEQVGDGLERADTRRVLGAKKELLTTSVIVRDQAGKQAVNEHHLTRLFVVNFPLVAKGNEHDVARVHGSPKAQTLALARCTKSAAGEKE